MTSQTVETIPHTTFSLAGIDPRQRFEVWRDSISFFFDIEAEKDLRQSPDFDATVDTFLWGEIVLARTQTTRQVWHRTEFNIARDGMDHYMLQLYTGGSMQFTRRGSDGVIGADTGGIIVYDLAQPSVTETTQFQNVSVFLPRARLAPLLRAPNDQHMRVLGRGEPLTALLYDHLLALNAQSENAQMGQISAVNNATLELAAACLNASSLDDAQDGKALTYEAKRLIAQRLDDPNLTVDEIVWVLGASRTSLYALFEAEGGIHAHVREQRLAKALRLLSSQAHAHLSVSTVARRCGFANESAFTRAFKARYGVTPRDVRATALQGVQRGPNVTHGLDQRYEHWIRDLNAG